MIRNISKKTELASEISTCNTVFSLAKGLMFHKRLGEEEAFLLDLGKERAGSIHTFFVLFNIDVIWLNKKKEVIALERKVRPFRPFVNPKVKARYILELPSGSIDKSNTEKGDKLNLYNMQNK